MAYTFYFTLLTKQHDSNSLWHLFPRGLFCVPVLWPLCLKHDFCTTSIITLLRTRFHMPEAVNLIKYKYTRRTVDMRLICLLSTGNISESTALMFIPDLEALRTY